MPVCNPSGVNQRTHYFSTGRFNEYDGKDWNRIFWDYEEDGADPIGFAHTHLNADPDLIQQQYRQQMQSSFAKLQESIQTPCYVPFSEHYRFQLQSLCLDADYVIDLHTSSNEGIDYLYYFRDREESARLFQLPVGILLDQYDGDAFDEAFIKPWLALEDCFAQLGRQIRFDVEAWTLELGSAMALNPESISNGMQGIQNYLRHKQVIDSVEPLPGALLEREMRLSTRSTVKKYYAPAGGFIQSRAELGTIVEAGQCLYQLLSFNNEQLPTLIDVQAEQGGLIFDRSINHAVNQGEYVLGVL
ncbi:MAG: succinylglutamate desuccinylase/aspartoacylase family protein [Elainellaceae cyanobacterium]